MKRPLKTLLLIGIAALVYYGVRHLYFRPSVGSGEESPSFETTLASGMSFSLSQLEGRYVLLDFWGSWCGPCLKTYPELRSLYSTYNGIEFRDADGFEIVSIAIERDSSRWVRALDKLQPEWPYQILDQSSSLRFFNGPIADLYGVKQLPTKFLLGPDGEIIGTQWSLDAISEFLEKQAADQ